MAELIFMASDFLFYPDQWGIYADLPQTWKCIQQK